MDYNLTDLAYTEDLLNDESEMCPAHRLPHWVTHGQTEYDHDECHSKKKYYPAFTKCLTKIASLNIDGLSGDFEDHGLKQVGRRDEIEDKNRR